MANADLIAQDVVNAWGINIAAGNETLMTPEFLGILDKACRYQHAKHQADFYRRRNALDEEMAHDETVARQAFISAYHPWCQRKEAELTPRLTTVQNAPVRR